MPMEYIVPSLRIAAITGMANRGALEERFAQLKELEEEWFVAGFHQQVQKKQDKVWHDHHIKGRTLKEMIWYYYMTTSLRNSLANFCCRENKISFYAKILRHRAAKPYCI